VIPNPPDVSTSAPVELLLDTVALLKVTIPDADIVVAAVTLPIAPGFKNVLPRTEDAFKFATFVVDVIDKGLVPVETVETKVLAVTVLPTYKLLVIPTPPETCNDPVVLEDESLVVCIVTFPDAIHKAYEFVIVILVPGIGAPCINNVAVLIVVTLVLLAASVGANI
jgi:hypothetical protein